VASWTREEMPSLPKMLEVRVDGALGDAELLRDVTVGHSLADQRRDLPLPAGQQAGWVR
jgi:hypothetical protein